MDSNKHDIPMTIKPKKFIKPDYTSAKNTKCMCRGCGRTFRRKTNYNAHILICEQLNDSKNMKMMMLDEKGHIPSQTEMFYLLRNVMTKCERLESEVTKLRKYVDVTKKQINALDWLNNNLTVNVSYSKWLKSISITQEELNNVFKCKYIEGVYQILEKRLPIDDTMNHPVKCFNQKNGMFFIYDDNKWSMMTMEKFNDLANTINVRLIKAFYVWKAKYIEEIENDDRMHDIYTENMRIVLGENKTSVQIIQRLKTRLYAYLKCDLKNIVRYDFTF
jgi:hypothetical protein